MRVSTCGWLALAGMGPLAACAGTSLKPPEVPPALRAPATQELFLETLASGVQIYECAQKADSTYEWAFKAPEASLALRSGSSVGRHYAGPTWEGSDGSKVVGEVKARDAGPDAGAIPWLLLAAKESSGSGTFGLAKSIQRVATVGGVAPTAPCTASNLRQVVRVPYTATYYFYR
jgi:hypothetical protein